jgi:hypothetical protein
VDPHLHVVQQLAVVLDPAVDAVEVRLLDEVEVAVVLEEGLVAAREEGADASVEAVRSGASFGFFSWPPS